MGLLSLIDCHGGVKPGRLGWRSHAEAVGRLHESIFTGRVQEVETSDPTRLLLFPDASELRDHKIRLGWEGIVEDSSSREIRRDSDRCYAIAGLAVKFQMALPD